MQVKSIQKKQVYQHIKHTQNIQCSNVRLLRYADCLDQSKQTVDQRQGNFSHNSANIHDIKTQKIGNVIQKARKSYKSSMNLKQLQHKIQSKSFALEFKEQAQNQFLLQPKKEKIQKQEKIFQNIALNSIQQNFNNMDKKRNKLCKKQQKYTNTQKLINQKRKKQNIQQKYQYLHRVQKKQQKNGILKKNSLTLFKKQEVRKLVQQKQLQLLNKWLKIDIQATYKEKVTSPNKNFIKSLKRQILKNLQVQQIKIDCLMQGLFIRDILKRHAQLNRQYIYKIQEIIRIIQVILQYQNQRKLSNNKVNHSFYHSAQSLPNNQLFKQPQQYHLKCSGDHHGLQRVNVNQNKQYKENNIKNLQIISESCHKTSKKNKLQKSNIQNKKQNFQDFMKNIDFQQNSKNNFKNSRKSKIINSLQKQCLNKQKKSVQYKCFLSKPKNIRSTYPIRNNDSYDLSYRIYDQQSPLFSQVHQKIQKNNFADSVHKTFNTKSVHLSNDKVKEIKYLNRQRLFKQFKFVKPEKQKIINKKQNTKVSDGFQKNQVQEFPKQFQTNFLKKGQSKYSAIINKNQLLKQYYKKSKKTSKNTSIISSLNHINEPLQQKILEKQNLSLSSSQLQINNNQSDPKQKNRLTSAQILNIISKNKGLPFLGVGYYEQQSQETQQILNNNYINKIKTIWKGKQPRTTLRKRYSFQRNSIIDKQSLNISQQNNIVEQNFNQQPKKSEIQQQYNRDTPKIKKMSSSIYKLKRYSTINHSLFTANCSKQNCLQICGEQDRLADDSNFNKNYNQKSQQCQMKETNGLNTNQNKEEQQQQNKNLYKKRYDLFQQLKNMKMQMKCMQQKINIQGANVFCKFTGSNTLNITAIQAGLNQYQSIHKLRKPYYLNVHYSKINKNTENNDIFQQDSSELDFIKIFETKMNVLGQKGFYDIKKKNIY